MTRINVVPVSELCDQHLRAELREITRIPNTIASGRAKIPAKIGTSYVLGKGHVTLFYNKLQWLRERHKQLISECRRRGFVANDYWPEYTFPKELMGTLTVTDEATRINRIRIKERWPKKAKYYSQDI